MQQDPVCGMYLIKTDENLVSKYKGKAYYFCCPCCKEEFDSNPERYSEKSKEIIQEQFHGCRKGDTEYV